MEKMLKKASAILLITTIMLSMLAYISASASFKGDTIYYTTSTDEVVQFDSSDFVDMLEDYDLEFVQLMITSPYYNGKSEYCMTNDWGKLVIDYNGRGGYLRECHPNDGLSFSRDIDAMEDYIDSLTYIPNEKMDSETIEIKYSISGIDEDGYLEYVEGVIKIEVISETETYTIRYDANGGSGAPASQTKEEDVDIFLSSKKPVRLDYKFLGWAVKASGNVKYDPGDRYEENRDITFYAVWEYIPKKYIVSYNANGGYGAPANQIKPEDEDIYLSSYIPTRYGYEFEGWGIKPNGSARYEPGEIYEENEDIVFYAIWRVPRETYTISYNANGGYGAPPSHKKTEDENTYLSSEMPTRSGYKFLGWATSAQGRVGYHPGSRYTADSSVTFYAIWEYIPEIYTISYHSNGGSGAPASQTKTEKVDTYLSDTEPTRSEYKFLGWATSKTGNVKYQPGSIYTSDDSVTLYAVWEYIPKTYTVSYNADGGSGAPISQTKTEGVAFYLNSVKPTRSGYKFLGWSTTPSGTVSYQPGSSYTEDKAITFYAVWEYLPGSYTVSYNANGGDGAPSSDSKTEGVVLYLSSVIPVRQSHKFLGWSTTPSGEVSYQPGAGYTSDKSVTLYAVWEYIPVNYIVSYNANGGSGAPQNQTKTENTTIYLSSVIPVRHGYKFLGWSTSAWGEANYQPGSSYTANSSITLYAVWEDDSRVSSTWECGTGITATLQSNGEMKISGTGMMTDYWDTDAPWHQNRS